MMEISEKQNKKIKEVAKKYGLKLVLLFGSFASGKDRKDSDLDIAVLCYQKISFYKEIKLIGAFSSIFGKDVDLSVLNRANPLLLFQVSRNSILLYGKKEDFFKLKIYSFKVYNDYTPYFEMERKINKKLISEYVS